MCGAFFCCCAGLFLISHLMVNQSMRNSSQRGGVRGSEEPGWITRWTEIQKDGMKKLWPPTPTETGKKDVSYVSAAPLGTFPQLSITFGNTDGTPPPHVWPVQAIQDNSPITAHIISASVPEALAHKKTDTKWYDSTIPFRNARKEKLLLAHSLSLAKLLCSTLLQSEATSALCWSLKRQRGTHTVPLLPCGTRSLWCEKKYVVSLCQSLAREATKKGKKRGC